MAVTSHYGKIFNQWNLETYSRLVVDMSEARNRARTRRSSPCKGAWETAWVRMYFISPAGLVRYLFDQWIWGLNEASSGSASLLRCNGEVSIVR